MFVRIAIKCHFHRQLKKPTIIHYFRKQVKSGHFAFILSLWRTGTEVLQMTFPQNSKHGNQLCGGLQSIFFFFEMLCNLRKIGLFRVVILNDLFILQKTWQSKLIIDSIADKLEARTTTEKNTTGDKITLGRILSVRKPPGILLNCYYFIYHTNGKKPLLYLNIIFPW